MNNTRTFATFPLLSDILLLFTRPLEQKKNTKNYCFWDDDDAGDDDDDEEHEEDE